MSIGKLRQMSKFLRGEASVQTQALARRVLIVKTGSVLAAGAQLLLAADAGLQVSSLSFTDEATLLQDIAAIAPDVVVLTEDGSLEAGCALRLFQSDLLATRLTVVVIRAGSGVLDIYEMRSVETRHSHEFVALVRSSQLAARARGPERAR